MSIIYYYYRNPLSAEAKLIKFFMGLLGMKRVMEKKIVNNTYRKTPAKIPKSLLKKFIVDFEEVEGRMVWTIAPSTSECETVILYLHGGAYYANITKMHWQLIEQLIESTNATFIVPDYPLAPESTCIQTIQFLDKLYEKLIPEYQSKQIDFMGDSAGGGLALSFAQKVRNDGQKQPQQIILFSPWLDVSMDCKDVLEFDKHDKILSIKGLKMAGTKYAGNLEIRDFRVSPIYGDFSALGKISVFVGTSEILISDALRLKYLLIDKGIDFNYFEYRSMFHDWVIVSNLPESKDVISCVNNLINYRTE